MDAAAETRGCWKAAAAAADDDDDADLLYYSVWCYPKIKFSMKDFFSKCDQISRKHEDLVKFTEEKL